MANTIVIAYLIETQNHLQQIVVNIVWKELTCLADI